MLNLHGKSVREIVLEMPVTTRVFEEFRIDYCCHGNTPFDEACRNVGASPDVVMKMIDGVLDAGGQGSGETIESASLDDLIQHILDEHHLYTRQEMVQLTPLMAKVASRHGEHYSFLLELKDLFHALCDDLDPHMMKEEMVLFPYIQNLEHSDTNHLIASYPPFGTVQHPVSMMSVEHEEVGELLSKMRALTSDYSLPDGACPSFTALFHRLGELERDLHLHIHLENNILFPRAIELEQKVSSPAIITD